jgi:hypothetical protein
MLSAPFVAAASVLTTIPSLLSNQPGSTVAGNTSPNFPVLKIDGWDCADGAVNAGTKIISTDQSGGSSIGNNVLIRINQSWRATWR